MAAFLAWHRLTLEVKCGGLSPQELARRSVDRSALSLLGLIRHHAEGERFWFRLVMAGENPAPLFPVSGPGAAFDVIDADLDMVTDARQAWRAEVTFADRLVFRCRRSGRCWS